ncbi:MAG: calcium/proton exchanger [Monoraphidium minutum]|nr:MAG: calcium/proton exchanger [Monoraphidium minutum]
MSGSVRRSEVGSRSKAAAIREMLVAKQGGRVSLSGEALPPEMQQALLPGTPLGGSMRSAAGGGGGDEGGGKWLSPAKDMAGSWTIMKSSWLNVLLVAVPLGLVSEHAGWSPSVTFLLNLAALVPLALLLGCVTEDLSLRLGQIVGGLLNATFGNVVEIILSIAALQKGLYQVVATSLLGSVLSNMLMVLGMSFVCGGIKYRILRFNSLASQSSVSLLLLSAISIVLPTAALHLSMGGAAEEHLSSESVLLMSRMTAVALLVVYAGYLFFQLGSHSDLFGGPEEEDEEGGGSMLSLGAASLWLGGITVLVAACSEALTGSIEEVSHVWGLSQSFLGFIVLPIAGNACEHITAVFVAMKDKMDLSMGIAIGSSIQIGLLAVPLVTIVGWATGHPFSLAFDPFSALVLVLSVIHTAVMISDAESNWLEGLQLLVTYFIIAVAYALTT